MAQQFRRILVRATNWVGDAVMSLPALHALRQAYPDSYIVVLARPSVADIYRREPVCDEVILYEAPKGWRGLWSKLSVAQKLRSMNFDAAVLFQNAFEAAALAWVARIPERIGYNRDGRGPLLTKAIAVPPEGEIPAHQRFYYLELLKRAGFIRGYANAEVVLSGANAAAARGRELLTQRGMRGAVIGVSPGAAYGIAKRWRPERFAAASAELAHQYAASVVVFGSSQEDSLGREVAALVSRQGVNVLSLAGVTSLGDFIDMAAACTMFLTNDSGSMHIASALGIPTVAVFGPTDAKATGPAGHAYAIVQKSVPCAPCNHRECPIDHRCMTGVTVEEVVDTAKTLLR